MVPNSTASPSNTVQISWICSHKKHQVTLCQHNF